MGKRTQQSPSYGGNPFQGRSGQRRSPEQVAGPKGRPPVGNGFTPQAAQHYGLPSRGGYTTPQGGVGQAYGTGVNRFDSYNPTGNLRAQLSQGAPASQQALQNLSLQQFGQPSPARQAAFNPPPQIPQYGAPIRPGFSPMSPQNSGYAPVQQQVRNQMAPQLMGTGQLDNATWLRLMQGG